MSSLNSKQLKNLPVMTKSGRLIGRIKDWEIDSASQTLTQYHVQSLTLLSGLYKSKLIIHRNQVIDLNTERLLVEDLVDVKRSQTELAPTN